MVGIKKPGGILKVCVRLREKKRKRKFYPDGKLMSETTVTYNNVMLPVKELRQFYPSGVLRRYQKHLGEKLVEGHVYNSEGKETEPFFEFKE